MLEELKDLDNSLLVALNGSDSIYWDSVMWIVTKTTTWIPLLIIVLYLVAKNSNWCRTVLVVAALAFTVLLADQLSSGLIKPLVMRWRPTHDVTFLHTIDTVFGYTGGRYGFVSSHAANTFSLALLFSLIWKDWRVTLPLMVWTALNCYGRMYLGVHYPGDILGGLAVGALVAVAAYYLLLYIEHKCQYKEKATLINGWWHWGIGIVFTLLCIIALIPF